MAFPSDTPSLPLAHRDLGGGDKPPLVILHGLLGSSRNWQSVGRDLSGHRRVHALDLRNHGLSPHSAVMSYGAMAADVAAWIESQGIGAFELMGHSMGGKVAMMVACALPRQVRRLIVVDIAPRRYHWPTRRAEFAAMRAIDLGRLASRAEAEAMLVPAVPDWAMRKFLTTNLERAESGAWRWAVNLPVIEAALSDLEANPLFPGDRYEGETLFVAGGQSDYIRPEDHAGIRTHFPESRIATLAESGHNPHMDAREAFVRALGPRDS